MLSISMESSCISLLFLKPLEHSVRKPNSLSILNSKSHSLSYRLSCPYLLLKNTIRFVNSFSLHYCTLYSYTFSSSILQDIRVVNDRLGFILFLFYFLFYFSYFFICDLGKRCDVTVTQSMKEI